MAASTSTLDLVQLAMESFLSEWEKNAVDAPLTEVDAVTGKAEFRNPQTAMEMLFNYIENRRGLLTSSGFKLLHIEQPFVVPLDPEDSSLLYVGRFDKVYEYEKAIYIAEHKTTSFYKKNGPFRSEFIDSFSPNSQIDGYLYAGHITFGDRLKGVNIDASLVHSTEHDGFRLLPIDRRFAQLDAWLWEARYWVNQIEANSEALDEAAQQKAANYLAAFPKNTSNCTQYGGCPYLDLCKMWGNPSLEPLPAGFKEEKWSPFDELKLAEAKKVLGLTSPIKRNRQDRLYDNTRLSTFRGCGRRYYFRHVRHWETQKDKRALLFGSSWHAAMDTVWAELAPNWPKELKPSNSNQRKKSSGHKRDLQSRIDASTTASRPNPKSYSRVGSKVRWIS